REVALVQLGQQDVVIGLAAAKLETLRLPMPIGLVPAQRYHRFAQRQMAEPVGAVHVAAEVRAKPPRSFGKQPQLLSLARSLGEPLAPARIEAADEPEHALVLHTRGAEREIVEMLFLERAAEAPIPAPIERVMTPQRYPLPVLLDAVSHYLCAHA